MNDHSPMKQRRFPLKTTYGEGPFTDHVNAEATPTREALATVPENGIPGSPAWEEIFVWILTTILVILLTWNSADLKFPSLTSSIPATPPVINPGIPFTLGGFFRRAFAIDFD